MDIFAHGLWTAAAVSGLNKKLKTENKKLLGVWWTTFWGVFPDLFAFTIPFIWIASSLIFGNLHLADIPRPHQVEPPTAPIYWAIHAANQLYNVSHSAIVFAAIFFLVWALRHYTSLLPLHVHKRPPWELCGWLLHILIDIPTHSYRFYPTPILWPVSDWKFLYGFSWSVPWFMILNYSALAIVYFLLWRKKKNAAT